MFQTEHSFTLPRGYVDEGGVLHREGVMRLARAADEILPLTDPRVEKNPAYLLVLLLSRVIVKLGPTVPTSFCDDIAEAGIRNTTAASAVTMSDESVIRVIELLR